MDGSRWLQSVYSLWLVPLCDARGVHRRVVVDARCRQTHWSEGQSLDGSCKWKASPLFDDEGEKIVGRMLLMQKLRSRLKEQGLHFNLGYQTGGRLMMLQDIIVVRQCVDIRQPRTLRKKITNGDLVGSFNAGNEIPYMLAQTDRT
jgi:hypothetical protein